MGRYRISCITGQACLGLALIVSVNFLTPWLPAAQAAEAHNVAPRASSADLAKIEAKRDQLFNQMMADPTNLDVAFEYAGLSSQAGDLEGAIATLERMLIYAPGLPRLQLELGVLYYRLGAYETAKTYFSNALQAPNVPDEVRHKVDTYLAAIHERTLVDQVSGTITTGLRWQSNANGGPEDRSVRTTLFPVPLLLDDGSTADSDINGFLATNLFYSHDLASQGDRFEASLQTYGALYAQHDEFNTGFAELHIGPTFDLNRFDIADATLSTYAIASGTMLHGDPYLLSGGLGISALKAVDGKTRLTIGTEYRREDFRDSDLRPTASDYTGDRYRVWTGFEHALTSDLLLTGTLFGEGKDAKVGYQSFSQVGVTLGLTYSFASPIAKGGAGPWTASLTVGHALTHFDKPDYLYSFDEAERDRETFVEGGLIVPVADDWAVQALAGYRNVASNYSIHAYHNVSASLGVIRKF